jgi:hypothetical protein
MTARVLDFPDDVFKRWARRHRYEAAISVDPTTDLLCRGCERDFAWRGYGDFCGWCWENGPELEGA